MTLQTSIDFSVHSRERTSQGEVILNSKRERLGGNCKKLLMYFQKNNIWLSDDNSRLWLNVRNLAQRVADLRHVNHIPVEDRIASGNYKEYRLKCTCRLVGGEDVVAGCYLHDETLKVV